MFAADGFGEKGKLAAGNEGAVPPNATLQITLELVSWKTVTEVTDDKKVIKKVLKEGEGYERPNEGAAVKCMLINVLLLHMQHLFADFLTSLFFTPSAVKLIGKLQDGTVFLKKGHGDGEDLFEFKTDEGNGSCVVYVPCFFVYALSCAD